MTRAKGAGFVLALALMSVSGAVLAQPTQADTGRARALFQQGLSLADHDRWAEALVCFQQSLGLVPRASTRFNIARALARLGRLRESVAAFDEYLREATAPSEAERVSEAQRLRAEAVASLSTLRLLGLPSDAEVSVDGEVRAGAGVSRSLTVDPGPHRVEARDRAGHVERFAVTLTASGTTEHALVWPAPPSSPPTEVIARPNLVIAPPPPPPPRRRSIASSPWLWVGVGATAVVATGVLLYVFRPTEDAYTGSTGESVQGITWE